MKFDEKARFGLDGWWETGNGGRGVSFTYKFDVSIICPNDELALSNPDAGHKRKGIFCDHLN